MTTNNQVNQQLAQNNQTIYRKREYQSGMLWSHLL